MFGSKKSEPVKTMATPSAKSVSYSTTIVTKCTEIKGDIKGCGTIHIDGIVHGDVDVEESVIIGESGIVYGNIKSKSVVLSGKLEGSIDCNKLEIMQSGSVSDRIDAKEMVADGLIEAVILVENSIHITDNGRVEAEQMQSKHIVVNGLISGNIIASELLEINRNGKVKGKMIVKKIKVTEGGLMLGTMLTYEDSDAIQTQSHKEEPPVEEESEDSSYQI
ncbi:putative [hydrothermal vent metagenome]|uniref:Putative n=1 Tax=hydrothermal vent metagenome TaxID=652676 RepID=A0A1W1BKG1_9ZZZZ